MAILGEIMTEQVRYILKGIGSILDIAPKTNYLRLIPRGTPNERIGRSWERTGHHLRVAIKRFEDDQEKEA